ncbi:DUF397 domain-containing protein [Streptomyces bacillaris]|uniref:DUF397 domain-containing protein n=1 Tax=Streptomyces bacillaris TaxID=68179 RepID=UPI0037F64C21
MRDSKNPSGPHLCFTAGEWQAFTSVRERAPTTSRTCGSRDWRAEHRSLRAARVPDPPCARWRTSSFSGGQGVRRGAPNLPHLVPVRDSKRPTGPAIAFGHDAWRGFVSELLCLTLGAVHGMHDETPRSIGNPVLE